MTKLLEVLAAILAGILVMIVHELIKAITFVLLDKSHRSWNVFCVQQYIDPVGLLFCVISKVGFSKSYMYKLKKRWITVSVGIMGFLSLLMMVGSGIIIYRSQYMNLNIQSLLISEDYSRIFQYLLLYYYMIISMSMFIINLFPITTFDIGLIIASISPGRFLAMIRSDYIIKLILLFLITIRFVKDCSNAIIIALLQW